MLSRVADSVYWMNRYVERAENIARFLDVTHQVALDLPPGRPEPWGALIDATGDAHLYHDKLDAETVTRYLCFDPEYPSSIVGCIQRARDNARQIREIISSEMWEQVNRAYFLVTEAAGDETAIAYAPHAFLTAVKLASQQYVGIADGTMTHNEAWHFGRLGMSLERADKTSRILDVMSLLFADDRTHDLSTDDSHWASLLKSASALEMYRKRHGSFEANAVATFLLFDDEFPRSVHACADRAARSLESIVARANAVGTPAEATSTALMRELEAARSCDLQTGLHGCIDKLQESLNRAGDAIHATFFDLAPPADSPSSRLIHE